MQSNNGNKGNVLELSQYPGLGRMRSFFFLNRAPDLEDVAFLCVSSSIS